MKTPSKNQLMKWLTLLLGACLTLAWAGCSDSTETAPTMEETMDAAEETAEDTADAMEDAAEDAVDAAEDAADEVSDGY